MRLDQTGEKKKKGQGGIQAQRMMLWNPGGPCGSDRAFFFFLKIKHKAMDSKKHPDSPRTPPPLFGGSRVGHGRGRDRWRQPGRKDSSIRPYYFPPPAMFKAPQSLLPVLL